MLKHIFVIGLDELNRAELETIHNASEYTFHALIDYDTIVNPLSYDMKAIMAQARRTLRAAPAVDAIIGHWDYPTTSMLPILRRECGLRTPTLESVLYCDSKYWNRVANQQAIPQCTPAFQGLDPYSDDAADTITLEYPFWLKPTTSFSSYLSYQINDEAQLREALATIRERIHVFAEPFEYLMQHCENRSALPAWGNGATCLAEGIIGGELCTLEGYVHDGEVVTYAIVDSVRGSNQVSFVNYQYPSTLPQSVQSRMKVCAETIVRHIGLDQTPFNIEFFWNEEHDKIWLLEINPRISQSHCPIFELATGTSHHEVAIDIALGRRPRFPLPEGDFPMAAKFMARVYGDATVTRVPSQDDIAALQQRYPELIVEPSVEEGMQLSELRGQDSFSFEIASLFFGGRNETELHHKFREIMQRLDFRFSEPLSNNYQGE